MNSTLRYVVMPWQVLSGMGNWSYGVLTEWANRDGVMSGSTPPRIFNSKDAAEEFARKESASWPYRSEAYFLHPDTGNYLPLS